MGTTSDRLDAYFKLQGEIYKAVGYEENWRVFPLDDQRGCHWMIVGDRTVAWSPGPFTLASIETGDVYSGEIYTQRHLSKWVYRGDGITMVIVDTQTDGNILAMVFDDANECTDEAMKEAWAETW